MLERVLRSETFGRSERARNLLRYLIDREQAGEAERLKGFAIAMDVFGKDSEFDPSTDAVVRVQAGRLRELLEQYYATEGTGDPVRVTIPRGSYVPAYQIVSTADTPPVAKEAAKDIVLAEEPSEIAPAEEQAVVADKQAPLSPQLARHVRMFWMALGAIIAMLGFLVLRITMPQEGVEEAAMAGAERGLSTASIASSYPIESLPTVHISADAADADAGKLAMIFRAGLAGFDTVEFLSREPSPRERVGRKPGTDFVFDITALSAAGKVVVELQHGTSGAVLVSRQFSPSSTSREDLDDEVADMLSSTVPVSGVIYGFIEQKKLQSGLTECLLLNDNYYLDQTPEKHRAAYDCFQRLLDTGAKSPLIYSELAALVLETITDGYAYPSGATLEQAMDLAHRGVLAGATSPYAHRAYGFTVGRNGNTAESIRWMRKAYELNTYDLSMAAAYGYALIYSGDYATGSPIMERAVEASSSHPSWWDYSLFLGEFMLGDMKRAASATEALISGKRPHYLAARIIAAHWDGNRQQTELLLKELGDTYPEFIKDPRSALQRSSYPPDLTQKLVDALRAAGLGSAS
jgi:tetratricopeptide (TPR) repeat protein